MISDDELDRQQRAVEELAGLGEPANQRETAPANPQRIERIVEKALYEAVVKDTTSFVFQSFGHALFGLTGAVMGHANSASAQSRQEQEPDSPSREEGFSNPDRG